MAVGICVVLCRRVDDVAHQVLCLVFYEETRAWEMDESVRECGIRGAGARLCRIECFQSVVVRTYLLDMGS
jgi:hypothetical protein